LNLLQRSIGLAFNTAKMSTNEPASEFRTPDGTRPTTPTISDPVNITSGLEDLQTDEQRRVLNTVAETRRAGLSSELSLPQLVVCGDQSAGKSSVLEAVTGIAFPRDDNLCTRYATEIIMRRAASESLTIKVIPSAERSSQEQEIIKAFSESITDFDDIPRVMKLAKKVIALGLTYI
jgi:hypothetical protein